MLAFHLHNNSGGEMPFYYGCANDEKWKFVLKFESRCQNKDEKKKVNKSGQHIVGHPRNDILMTFFYLHLVLRFGAQPKWKCYWAEVYLSERDARM